MFESFFANTAHFQMIKFSFQTVELKKQKQIKNKQTNKEMYYYCNNTTALKKKITMILFYRTKLQKIKLQ